MTEIDTSLYSDGFADGYRQGKKDAEPHWIPVTERIADYGEEVLTINADGDYEINHIIDEEDAEWFYDGVVAWMPLPKGYKGGKEQ